MSEDMEALRYDGAVDPQSVLEGRNRRTPPGGSPNPSQAASEPPSQPQEAVPEHPGEPEIQFDPRYRDALTGMMYLGRLEEKFEWGGHTFVIRTLTIGEQVEAGILVKPALGTRVEIRAHQAATVAAGLVSVDDVPLILPLGEKAEPTQRDKFNHLMTKWYPQTVDQVYGRIFRLEERAKRLVDAMGEAESQGGQTPG